MYLQGGTLEIMARQEVEAKIVTKVVDDLLAAGCKLSVEDGEGGFLVKGSTNRELILNNLMEMDEDRLHVLVPPRRDEAQELVGFDGWVYFVYGNEGETVISDYTTNLDDAGLLKGASALADKYEDWSSWATNSYEFRHKKSRADELRQLIVDFIIRTQENKVRKACLGQISDADNGSEKA